MGVSKAVWISGLTIVVLSLACADMMRKSIVFDMKTPKVFYCPQDKPTDMDKMIVKARPITKLCEYEGKGVPKHYKSDCYNDIDESEYACAEKQRILTRMHPPNDTEVPTDPPVIMKKHKPKKW